MSLFTVEQVELVRRLRLSGITPEQVIEAFRALDKLDAELGLIGTRTGRSSSMGSGSNHHHHQIPINGAPSFTNGHPKPTAVLTQSTFGQKHDSPPMTHSRPSVANDHRASLPQSSIVAAGTTGGGVRASPLLLQQLNSQNHRSKSVVSTTTVNGSSSAAAMSALESALNTAPRQCSQPPSAPAAVCVTTSAVHSVPPNLLPFLSAGSFMDLKPSHVQSVPNPAISLSPSLSELHRNSISDSTSDSCGGSIRRLPKPEVLTYCSLDDPNELDEFLARGEEQCIAEMRDFVTQSSLRQTTVAQMTGVSQPYISKFLNGNYRELSQRVRRNIFSWYLNCRRHPEKINKFFADPANAARFAPDPLAIPPSPSSAIATFAGGVDTSAMSSAERNLVKPQLVEILQTNFAEQQQPDFEQRLHIAAQCNKALQIEKGSGLSPRDVVSPQLIANWFYRRRKCLKRKNNEDIDQLMNNDSTVTDATVAVEYCHSERDSSPDIVSPHRDASPPADSTVDCTSTVTPSSLRFSIVDAIPPNKFRDIQSELAAVNNSVLALVDPYGEHQSQSAVVKAETVAHT